MRQFELQANEIHRIGLAVRSRGGARGTRNRVRVAFGLPQAWIGRLVFRAQRNTLAMEARGYAGEPVVFRRQAWRSRDVLCVSTTVAAALFALWLRWRGGT